MTPNTTTTTTATLIVGGTVVTMNPTRDVVEPAAIAIADGRIAAVGPVSALRGRHPGATEVDATGCVITPGLVNSHQHVSGDRYMRSRIPDDLESGEAIFGWVQPMHAGHGPADDELSTVMASMESIANGVTMIVCAGTEAYPTRVAAGFRAIGMRGVVGTWGWDLLSGPFKTSADAAIDAQRAVVEAFPASADDLVRGWVTLVGHSLVSDELLVRGNELALEHGTGLSFHISPTTHDVAAYLERDGLRPLVHLQRLGVLGPHVLLGHAVHVDDDEMDSLEATGAAVAYCPWAYLRLGQGVTHAGRHAEMVRRGIRVALGCDSENAGDQLDVLRAATLAAGLAKDITLNPTEMGAHGAFELATIGGATAIGMGAEIGSIEVGKRADIVVHDCSSPQWQPRSNDVVHQLVWASDGRSVRDVFIGGRQVLRDKRFVTVDAGEVQAEVERAAQRVRDQVGLPDRPVWPTRSPNWTD